MSLSKIEIKLEIYESEESQKIDEKTSTEEEFEEKEKYILTTLFIDGLAITSMPTENGFSIGDVSDYSAFLMKSMDNRPNYLKKEEKTRYSSFYPITCSCGEAGCAGIWEGIHSFHKKNIVKWKITDRKTRKILGAKYLSFDKKQYEDEISKIWDFLEKNKNEYLYDYGSKTLIKEYIDFYKKALKEK